MGALRLIVSSASGVSVMPLPSKRLVVIGRSSEADLVVEDPSVSRRHAGLELGDPIELTDLDSRHGTRLLGQRLRAHEPAVLAPGSAFELGAVTVLLDLVPSGKERDAPPPSRGVPPSVVVADPTMKRLWSLLEVVGPSELNVLILGETGTGKEVFTEAVVAASRRADKPLVKLNCAALSPALLESELFGHERGAFTGADRAKEGLIEAADGGTIFLDEVGELPLELQAKLLRVVEAGEVLRVGAVKPRRVDVRYVSATNVPLEEAVADKRFRADLLFRLNGFTLRLPPLRERRGDVLPLAEGFIARVAERQGIAAPRLSAEAQTLLEQHPFTGNVRELKNLLERAIALARGASELTPEHMLLDGRVEAARTEGAASVAVTAAGAGGRGAPAVTTQPPPALEASMASFERDRIVEALTAAGGNQTEAAKRLGVSRRTLINKLELHDIPRPRKRGT